MRNKAPERAPLIAQRKKAALLKKRAALLTSLSKADKTTIIKVQKKRNCNDNCISNSEDFYKRINPRDSTLSSLTPSLSTLELGSSFSTQSESSFDDGSIDDNKEDIVQEEKPITTHLCIDNHDICRTMARLKMEFTLIERDARHEIADVATSTVEKANKAIERKLSSNLDLAYDHLRHGDASNAKIEYEEAIRICKGCKNHALVSHLYNAYGNFLSACLENHKRATIVLSEAASINIESHQETIERCLAMSYSSLGRVYISRSLATGIKDDGLNNLKRADTCFSMALVIYSKYEESVNISNIKSFMKQSDDFRNGAKRTLWNEILVIEALHDVDSDDSSLESTSKVDSVKDIELDTLSNFCNWSACLSTILEEGGDNRSGIDVSFLQDLGQKYCNNLGSQVIKLNGADS